MAERQQSSCYASYTSRVATPSATNPLDIPPHGSTPLDIPPQGTTPSRGVTPPTRLRQYLPRAATAQPVCPATCPPKAPASPKHHTSLPPNFSHPDPYL